MDQLLHDGPLNQFGSLFGTNLTQFNTKIFTKSYAALFRALFLSLSIIIYFIWLEINPTHLRIVKFAAYDIFREFLWAISVLVIVMITIKNQGKILVLFNLISKLPFGLSAYKRKLLLDKVSIINFLYYSVILQIYYFGYYDWEYFGSLGENIISLFAYNASSFFIILWCLQQINLYQILEEEFRKLINQPKVDLGSFNENVGILKKMLKVSQVIYPFLLLFTSFLFTGLLFHVFFFYEEEMVVIKLKIYVILADLPLLIIFYVIIRISVVENLVSCLQILKNYYEYSFNFSITQDLRLEINSVTSET